MATNTSQSRTARYGEEFKSFLSETWLGYALILPAVILLAAIIFYPTLRGVRWRSWKSRCCNPDRRNSSVSRTSLRW